MFRPFRRSPAARLAGLLAVLAALAAPAAAQTPATPPPAADAMLVLDASGSMWGQLNGRSKIELARDAVAGMLRQWPAGQALGLMAYGHRSKGDCQDIELLRPLSPLGSDGAAALQATVNGLQPKGMTPISESVRQAARQLRHTERAATVILVSDGEETCQADPCAVAAELEASGVNFTAHVIGFDVAAGSKARQQLQCLAERTGGRYLDARNAAELNQALGQVTQASTDACAGFEQALAMMPGTALSPDGDEQPVAGAQRFDVARLPDGADARACQALCLGAPGCMAWRYEAKDHLFIDHGRCFRYGAAASLLREDRAAGPKEVVSGVRAGAKVVKQGAGFAHCSAAARPAAPPPGTRR
ncbi:VWA domain-containing protein [Piscinibacter sakaiensis]|uniref:VWA domain-containing protein n=1 Tax=Piscinibacter sakaiensis TaxID=1547922 RepID=UPI0009EB7441|nr:VWA domain-containing protein [Piscinibacter sakaiensis]